MSDEHSQASHPPKPRPPWTTERTRREVIEGRLLQAITKEPCEQVALLVTENDLRLLISALEDYAGCDTRRWRKEEALDFVAGLKKLHAHAFHNKR